MEYLLPEGADARAVLGAHLDVRAGRARDGDATFYDTFDGRLHAEGVTLRHAGGRLALLDRATGEELASAEAPAARRLFDADLPEPLRERLAPVIEMRALLPVARVRARRLPLAVLNDDAKTVVRLAVETHDGARGRVAASRRARLRRRARARAGRARRRAGAARGDGPARRRGDRRRRRAPRGHERQARSSSSTPTSPPTRPRRSCSTACSR